MYLPQFHPIPENDAWWGPGFTEWTNVTKARPLFRGHEQPRVPTELGYYDLRNPDVREAQATLARTHGIEAFCYYHYWFAGRRILEQPFADVLASGQPDFPFCLCWANQSWTGTWHGAPHRTLIEQTYPGREDHRRHFEALLPAFADPRYLRVGGRPVFVIFRPLQLPDAPATLACWRELAALAGLPGLYIIGQQDDPELDLQRQGFDAGMIVQLPPRAVWQHPLRNLLSNAGALLGRPRVIAYERFVRAAVPPATRIRMHPTVIPNWDNTPRSGARGLVLHGSTPERFRAHLRAAVDRVRDEPADERLLFIKSWNEWAESNYLEPDRQWGRAYVEVVRDELSRSPRGDLSRTAPH